MALFSAGDFTGYTSTFAVPSGISDVLFAGSVDLILSTGITQQVFDTLSTALKCIHYMEANKLYSLSPNEDVTILNLRSKLLILEKTYINQKMMNSYVLLTMEVKLKQFIVLWLIWFLFQRHLLLSGFVVSVFPGPLISIQNFKRIVLIKIGLVFKSWIMSTNHPLYPILIL